MFFINMTENTDIIFIPRKLLIGDTLKGSVTGGLLGKYWLVIRGLLAKKDNLN